jgi:predicted ribosome quality control (RQC) complex YloA/Tae2 family protein
MQQLDAMTLKALAAELQLLLDGAKVSKVQHPSAREFVIAFWGGPIRADHRSLFYIQLSPEAPFCVLTDAKHRQAIARNEFEKPTALCMLLRKHLNGANLTAVRTLPGERVLDLVFENFNELGNRVRLVLSLELMGKHSNMIFYDDVQGVILAVAHGVSESMSSYRELAAGLSYAPPPRPAGKQLLSEMTRQEFSALWAQKPPEETGAVYLNRHLAGLGQRIVEAAIAETGATTQAEAIYHVLTQLETGQSARPVISRDGETFALLPLREEGESSRLSAAQPDLWKPCETVNALVEAYFIGHLRESRMRRRQEQLGAILEQQLKKLHRREKELSPVAEGEIETLQATGDRILAAYSAGEVPREGPPRGGEAHQADHGRVSLTHYETGEPWLIDIDPSVDWVENAQIYYRRAKKAKARQETYSQMVDRLHEERDYLESLKQLTANADTLAELDAIESDMGEAAFGKAGEFGKTGGFGPKAGESAAKGKIRTSKGARKNEGRKAEKKTGSPQAKAFAGVMALRSSDGLEILLGKSAQGNDSIVGKLSRSDDIWLHVHQMPGSHVLVRAGKEAVPDQTLLEAATLAAHYSSARHSVNIPVIYTQSKFVRKIPQSYPGHVNYRQEKTVFITPDNVLLARLLGDTLQHAGI